jgi:hypothetical protein
MGSLPATGGSGALDAAATGDRISRMLRPRPRFKGHSFRSRLAKSLGHDRTWGEDQAQLHSDCRVAT